MRRSLSRSLLAAVLVTLIAGAGAGPARAAAGPVTVRVEGSAFTLLAPTLVATRSGSYTPLGKTAACPGTSAAEALDLATLAAGTGWGGTFNAGFGDYFVTSIAGEQHPAGAGDGSYWSFWYDHAPAQTGICGQALNPGDEILFFPDCFGTCPAGFVSPNVLGLSAPPAVVPKGGSVTVNVTSYANADGHPTPAVGATVSGGGVSATTGASGAATVTFAAAGTFTLRATAANSVRSEPRTVCVHDGNDGNCGTPAPPGTTPTPPPAPPAPSPTPPAAPACVHHGNDGLCGTADQVAPKGHLAIPENTRFPHGQGPRLIIGRVDPDPSGLRDVRLRLTRVVSHGRCEAYSGARRKWATARCGVTHAAFFSIGRAPAFSYLMPARLGRGRYTVDVEAIDGAGNADAAAPGRNRIVFRVE